MLESLQRAEQAAICARQGAVAGASSGRPRSSRMSPSGVNVLPAHVLNIFPDDTRVAYLREMGRDVLHTQPRCMPGEYFWGH